MTIPNKFMEEAKRLVFCLIDEENAKVGIHIHTSLDEMEESIAISLQAAEERGRKAVLDKLESIDPLEAPSHAWEEGPDDLLAGDIHTYIVKQAGSLSKPEVGKP